MIRIEQNTAARTLGAMALAALLALNSAPAMAQSFNQAYSGWSVANPQADVDGNLSGIEATFAGRGSFGRVSNHVVADIVFNGAPCEFDSETQGLTLDFIAHSDILVTRNGDQLYRKMSSAPPSEVCLNPLEGTTVSTIYLDVVGGTGRFEEATGSTVLTLKVRSLGEQSSIVGTEQGQIFGVRKRQGGKDD